MHVGRSMWPNDIFGMTAEDDVITLLNIYSCGMAEKKQGEVTPRPQLPFFSHHLTVKAHECRSAKSSLTLGVTVRNKNNNKTKQKTKTHKQINEKCPLC